MNTAIDCRWYRSPKGPHWLIAHREAFPQRPLDQAPPWAHLFRHLLGAYRLKRKLESELFIEFNPLHLGGNKFVSPNARAWLPAMGMGVRPHKDPPRMAGMEDADDFDPAAPFPFFSHPLCRITRETKKDHCWDTMIGYGSLVVMLSPSLSAPLAAEMKAGLLPMVKEPLFQVYDEYWLLLDPDAMAMAEADLATRLGGVQMYFRECADSRAAMLLSVEPLDAFLTPFRPQIDPKDPTRVQLSIDELEPAPSLGSSGTKPDETDF